jgi:AcrR family transcriptional regulator
MSKIRSAVTGGTAQNADRRRRRRSDATQNAEAILTAAITVLNGAPDASIEDIARAAGVTRQTVYAHFPSREALLDALIERVTQEVASAFSAAGPEDAPPAVALTRLLDVVWQAMTRYSFAWHLPAVSAEQDAARHGPVLERMRAIIKRGQDDGDFDRSVSPDWLLAAVLGLGRTAEDEVKAGRMTVEEATHAVRHGFLRLLGLPDQERT